MSEKDVITGIVFFVKKNIKGKTGGIDIAISIDRIHLSDTKSWLVKRQKNDNKSYSLIHTRKYSVLRRFEEF